MLAYNHKKLSDNTENITSRKLQYGFEVTLNETSNKSIIEIIRVGTYQHAEYGEIIVDDPRLDSMIINFNNKSYGQDIFVDVAHEPEKGSAAKIERLFKENKTLKAEVTWTPYGIDAIKNKGFQYISADYLENHIDNETKQQNGCLLRGAALVTRPHIKNMRPVQLVESALSEKFIERLLHEAEENMEKYLKKLREYYTSLNLSEALIDRLLSSYKQSAQAIGDNEIKLKELSESFEETGKTFSKQLSDNAANDLSAATSNVISLSDVDGRVKQLLEEERQAKANADTKAQAKLNQNIKLFNETIDAGQGLSDEVKKELKANNTSLSVDMSEASVKSLAESFIKAAHATEAAKQLSERGYHVTGSPAISAQQGNEVRQLQETINTGLRNTAAAANSRIQLLAENDLPPFAQMVLAEFDNQNFARLLEEQRLLSGEGTTHTGTHFIPASVTRNVIREALSDLRVLELVQTTIDSGATATTQIPYEVRGSNTIQNDGIVFESQGIPFSGVGTDHELAYVNAMKLALKVTNEVMHFTQHGAVNWNAWGENIAANARAIKEIISRRCANEMLRASDSYNALAVDNEKVDVEKGAFKTAQFPVVRPRIDRDLKGKMVGNPICPITIKLGGKVLQPYDGVHNTDDHYYILANVNLGYIYIVDKNGARINGTQKATISYFTPTNLIKFDLHHADGSYERHLNGLLSAFGKQKAKLSSERYVQPEFALMSPVFNNNATEAEQFAASQRRDGTNTSTLNGDLVDIKGIPAFQTNAPAIDLGDERALLGRRNVTAYVIAKPWMVGQPFEASNANGQPTGEKVAYGEEYNAITTPAPVCKQFTSVLAFNSETRGKEEL